MAEKKPECFVIMPIAERKDYEDGHFKDVYECLIKPACEKAGFKAVRADDIEKADVIHMSIMKKIVEAPMAICDLSTRNPNVLFELGLRQAFDKPVVLIQEKGTERIFDVSILRAYDYCKELIYKEVLEDQDAIARILKGTEKDFVTGEGFNSITKFLSIPNAAQIKTVDDPNEQLRMQLYQISSQMNDMSSELRSLNNKEEKKITTIGGKPLYISKEGRISLKNTNTLRDYYKEFREAFDSGDYDRMRYIYNLASSSKIYLNDEIMYIEEMKKQLEELKKNNN